MYQKCGIFRARLFQTALLVEAVAEEDLVTYAHTYIYTHIYVYVYICIYVCICIHIYIHVYIYTVICMNGYSYHVIVSKAFFQKMCRGVYTTDSEQIVWPKTSCFE